MSVTMQETIRRTYKLRLSREQILDALREKYDIPDNAGMFVHVPGGGDWSNTDLDIEQQTPLVVQWETPS